MNRRQTVGFGEARSQASGHEAEDRARRSGLGRGVAGRDAGGASGVGEVHRGPGVVPVRLARPAVTDVLSRLVAAYATDWSIRTLMQAIANDPAFLDPKNVLVKQPVEWAVGLMRALGVRPAALPQKDADGLRGGLRALGQVPFDPPSVGGWPAGSLWLTTGAALGRLSLAQLVVRNADLSKVADAAPAARVALAGVKGDPKALVAIGACAPEYVVSR